MRVLCGCEEEALALVLAVQHFEANLFGGGGDIAV